MGRYVLLGVLLIGLSVSAPRAQTADADIRAIISSQIEAFKVDDFETAFSFASPAIKRMFGNSQRFGQMVQSGYPMVWRPAQVKFSGLETRSGRTIQSVVVTDGSGAMFVLDYDMVASDAGWLINGVSVRRPGDAGA